MQAQLERGVVCLKCAAGNLLIAQDHVHGVAPAMDADVGDNGIGAVSVGADRWPLFVLDNDLLPTGRQQDFRFCVCLRDDDGTAFALACEAFDLLPVSDLQLHPLPECMRNHKTPFDALTRVADTAALCLNLTALRRHLETLEQ